MPTLTPTMAATLTPQPTPTEVSNVTPTMTPKPASDDTPTPETAATVTPTPVPNVPPVLIVLELDDKSVSSQDDLFSNVRIDEEVAVKVRATDEDKNLDFVALLDVNDKILVRDDCGDQRRHQCTKSLKITAPSKANRTKEFGAIAVDLQGQWSAITRLSIKTKPRSSGGGGGGGNSSGGGGSSNPTSTPVPTATFTPVPTPTFTPLPTATFTPVPTATFTPTPTSTPGSGPTSTPTITPTSTPLPPPILSVADGTGSASQTIQVDIELEQIFDGIAGRLL